MRISKPFLCALFFVQFLILPCKISAYGDTLKIGVILSKDGYNEKLQSPTKDGISIAIKNSPLNSESFYLAEECYWKCKEENLQGFDSSKTIWGLPVKLCYSKKNGVVAQMEDLLNVDSVLIIIGLPNSSMVDEIFLTKELNIPVISTIATATEFTIKSRNNFKSKHDQRLWELNHKWFFRSTSSDIYRIQALMDWMTECNISNSFILAGNNTYGNGLLNDFQYLNKTEFDSQFRSKVHYYNSGFNSVVNSDSIKHIIDIIRQDKNAIESIVLFGYSADESEVIKKIKKYTGEIPIFVVEPNINKDEGIFWGNEFDKVRALSAQLLWNGDFEIKKFTEEYSKYSKDNNFVKDQAVPLSAGFAYDATVISLYAIHKSIESVKKKIWDKLSSTSKRELIRNNLVNLGNMPLIMSKGQITQSHDVIAKLQRTYIEDNEFYMFVETPKGFSWYWPLLILGGTVGGLSRVMIYISGKLKNKDDGSYIPTKKYIFSSVLIGIFGALIISIFWDTTIISEILPKFFDQFNLKKDTFVAGLLGGIVPTAIVGALSKSNA